MNPSKSDLRRSLKQARLALSVDERQAKSTVITSRLWQAMDWGRVTSIHCYQPIEHLGEVDSSDFVTALQTEYPGIQLFTSSQIDKSWKVVSASDGKPVTAPKLDVIIVPMLGFDENLHRLGYGGGYYDRFLAAQPGAFKIGLCFDLGKLDHLPAEPHDIPLDTIITETGKYESIVT